MIEFLNTVFVKVFWFHVIAGVVVFALALKYETDENEEKFAAAWSYCVIACASSLVISTITRLLI